MMQSGSSKTLECSTVFFLNGHIGRTRTGIENAALLRAQLFEQYLPLIPVICTVHYEPHFPEIRQLLVAQGLASPALQFRNLYDDLQGFSCNVACHSLGGDRSNSLNQSIIKGGRAEQVVGSVDARVFDASGRPVAYCKYSEDQSCLQHVNYLHQGRVWKRDTYHSSGRISRTQFIDPTTGLARHEVYFNRQQQVVLTRFCELVSGKVSTAKIILHLQGSSPVEFCSDGELILYWLRGLVNQTQGRLVFCCDRIRLFAEPLSRLMAESDPRRVVVIPVLHAVHARRVGGIRSGPINANFTSVLRDLKRFPAVVVGTQRQRRDIETRFDATNILAIPPGSCIPRLPLSDLSRERLKLVYIARYSAEKRHHLAIEIFSRVLLECPQARMEFYGSGKRMQPIIDDVYARRLEHAISVNGFTQQPHAVYASSGLSILTSQGEGFALGVLESLAAGCPVISFDVPYGPADMIEDGHNGALIPEGDLEGFTQRVVRILRDEDLHHRLIYNCPQSIDKFSQSAVAAQWELLLRSATGTASN